MEKTIDKEYTIPSYELVTIGKVLTRLKNKGVPVEYELVKEVAVPVFPAKGGVVGSFPIGKIDCSVIRVSGEFKVNGYELIAKISHEKDDEGKPMNIVFRIGNKDIPLPKEYLEAKPECDYCHTKRERKVTFVLYNAEENKYIHLGGECLEYFTDGLSASDTAEALDTLSVIEDLDMNEKRMTDEMLDKMSVIFREQDTYKISVIVPIAYKVIAKDGRYIKSQFGYSISTIGKTLDIYKKGGCKEDTALTNDFFDFLSKQYDSGNRLYWSNVKKLIKNEYVYDDYLAVLISAVAFYWRRKEETNANNIKDEYLGKVGDKVTFTIKQRTILYTKWFEYGFNRGKESNVYRIISEGGHIILWTTEKTLYTGDKVSATIKELKEYKGEKETIVTKGKVV